MRENTGTKRDLLVEISLREAITTEFQLGRLDISKVCIQNSKGV
jgi:hypothetical protein